MRKLFQSVVRRSFAASYERRHIGHSAGQMQVLLGALGLESPPQILKRIDVSIVNPESLKNMNLPVEGMAEADFLS
jgi:hypothetical protein